MARRLMRAARSLNYNRGLQPLVADRIERAEGKLRGYLLARGLTTLRLGASEVTIDEEGAIDLERVAIDDDWQQMPLPERSNGGQPGLGSSGSGTAAASTVQAHGSGHQGEKSSVEAEKYLYERARQT